MSMVSVIIPIYNSKQYIQRCLNSVLGQTYTDTEILLMDDGSTDGSAQACDEFASRDERIKAVHLKNGGAAYARNQGLERAKGELILFVDSDDYIPENHIQALFDALNKAQADMAVAGVTYIPGPTVEHAFCVWNTTQLIQSVCYRDGIGDYPISKLYKKEMFDGIRFEQGITSEDFEIFYKLYSRAEKAVITDATTYYYLQNSESVSNGDFSTKFFNRMDICDRLIENIEREHCDILPSAYSRAVDENIWLYGITPKKYKAEKARMKQTVKRYAKLVEKDPKVTAKVKRKLRIFSLHPALWSFRMWCKKLLIAIYGRWYKEGEYSGK